MRLNEGVARRPIPHQELDLIRQNEGCKLRIYDDKQPNRTQFASEADVIGTPTGGYGSTRGFTKADVVAGKTITQAEADQRALDDMQGAEDLLYSVVKADRISQLSENQYAALLDFVFNCGVPPKISQLLNAGRFKELPARMSLYTKSDGQRMQGLVDRRRREVDLWKKDATDDTSAARGFMDVQPEGFQLPFASRTFWASSVAGFGSVGSGASIAVAQIAPHSDGNHVLTTVVTVLVCISAVAAFCAATFRAQDAKPQGDQ